MSENVKLVLTLIIGYLLGSISTGVIVSRVFGHKDIRSEGSGNSGTTNMLRVMGKKYALLTFAGDLFKGIAAVLIGKAWLGTQAGEIVGAFGDLIQRVAFLQAVNRPAVFAEPSVSAGRHTQHIARPKRRQPDILVILPKRPERNVGRKHDIHNALPLLHGVRRRTHRAGTPLAHRHAEDITHQQMPRRDIRVGIHQGAHADAKLAGNQIKTIAALHAVGFAARRACAGIRLKRRLVNQLVFRHGCVDLIHKRTAPFDVLLKAYASRSCLCMKSAENRAIRVKERQLF